MDDVANKPQQSEGIYQFFFETSDIKWALLSIYIQTESDEETLLHIFNDKEGENGLWIHINKTHMGQ